MIRHMQREEAGFNLLELMIVVAIMSILVAIAMASYAVSVQNARTISCIANQRILDEAASVFRAESERNPTDIEDLRGYANTFDKITYCPSDRTVKLSWNTTTEEIECAIHPR